jgi:hypothetical protein
VAVVALGVAMVALGVAQGLLVDISVMS